MSGTGWAVGVVVPARDEAQAIAPCLSSVAASLAVAPVATSAVIVVADRCRDDTAARAVELLDEGHVLTTAVGNVGRARRLGTAHVLGRLLATGARLDRVWLCSTDADSTVPLDWITSHLRHAEAGAAAVAGVVRVDSFVEHPPAVGDRHREHYAAGVLDRPSSGLGHHHVHGANLGVRADAYLDVDGWSGMATAEDHDLWRRLRAAGHPVVASIDTWVTTSGRALGRAPDGFAGHLASLVADP